MKTWRSDGGIYCLSCNKLLLEHIEQKLCPGPTQSNAKPEDLIPTHEQIQIVFNWLMQDEDQPNQQSGWWSGHEDVERVKDLIRKLFAEKATDEHSISQQV
jgi:hypothetical protein